MQKLDAESTKSSQESYSTYKVLWLVIAVCFFSFLTLMVSMAVYMYVSYEIIHLVYMSLTGLSPANNMLGIMVPLAFLITTLLFRNIGGKEYQASFVKYYVRRLIKYPIYVLGVTHIINSLIVYFS